ncbi:hypothetical protein FRC03_010866 [Tulasnella sp. 419]|nr:hypothetical protein FRC03_010866 [Tulasnella sp. 419]
MVSPEVASSDSRTPLQRKEDESDSGDEQWADANDEIPPVHNSDEREISLPESHPENKSIGEIEPSTESKLPVRAEYPQGRDPEEEFTDEELRKLIDQATALKNEGNKSFMDSNWDSASDSYKKALICIPARHSQPPSIPNVDQKDPKGKGKAKDGEDSDQDRLDSLESATQPTSDIQEEVKFCTEALLDDPQYVKALLRRAESNEEIGSWTSMSSAEKDYKILLSILPASSPSRPQVLKSLRTLPGRIEAAQKKETNEMIGKLKDLGNTVLGKFGLSTDNFQFTPNGSGGYSMNFVK